MLKPLVPKFRSDISARLRDIAKKQVPARLKLIRLLSAMSDSTANVRAEAPIPHPH